MGRDDRSASRPRSPVTWESLERELTVDEHSVIDQLLEIHPSSVGFRGDFIGYDDPPALERIAGQKFNRNGHEKIIPDQYLPQHVWQAFQGMQAAMREDTGMAVHIESGYRSSAQQVLTFLSYLVKNNYDAQKVASGVALPGYSQHGDVTHTAIDVIDNNGVPDDVDTQSFAHTPAYDWLLSHAHEHGFRLSYPQDNSDGIKFEPWHWLYVGDSAA